MYEPLALALAAAGKSDAVLDEAGIAVDELGSSNARIPISAADRIWEHVLSVTGDRYFPLRAAEYVKPCDLANYLAASEKTLGEALPAWIDCLRLDTDALHWTLEDSEDALLTLHTGPKLPSAGPFAEYLLATRQVFLRRFGPRGWTLRFVSFRHAAPANLEPFERIFGTRPRFGAALDQLGFDGALLGAPMPRSDEALAEILRNYAERVRGELTGTDSLAERVGKSLRAGADRGISSVARELGMAPRSLQRALIAEGTSYREIAANVRRAEAERLLLRKEFSICEVAAELGFANVSTFHRAFTRWTGFTPGAFRAREAAADSRRAQLVLGD
ncbi:MAG TPA: AraC family transcriptional regulator ligand-binding domain-containing protein [Polyangiaceae bacterium]